MNWSSVAGSEAWRLFPSGFTDVGHLHRWTLTGDTVLPWAFCSSCPWSPNSLVYTQLQRELRVDFRFFFMVYFISFLHTVTYFPGCRVTPSGQVVTPFDWALHISFSMIQRLGHSEWDDLIPPSLLHSSHTEDMIIPQHWCQLQCPWSPRRNQHQLPKSQTKNYFCLSTSLGEYIHLGYWGTLQVFHKSTQITPVQ